MKKHLLYLLPIAATVNFAFAQTITVKGTVKADQGTTIPLALVQDKSDNVAARTDSTGAFTLDVKPNSKLLITCTGYQEKTVPVNGNTDLLVILRSEKADAQPTADAMAGNSPFNSYNQGYGAAAGIIHGSSGTGGLYPVFTYHEDTRGNRYLFNDWVSGYVTAPDGSTFKDPKYGFNYDKIDGGLLLTQDKHAAIEIDKDKIKSFTLYNEAGNELTYAYVPAIDKTHYAQVIADGKKYSVYKLTKTRFVKNNYHSDGMTSTGNNYDEYVDENTYYVVNNETKQVQVLPLKRKGIKTVFAADGKKVDTFLSAYDGDMDDSYVKNLGDFMNK